MGEVAGVDPADHSVLSGFKAAVYDETGTGSWVDDAKLEIVWRDTHGKEIPEHLEPLLVDDDA